MSWQRPDSTIGDPTGILQWLNSETTLIEYIRLKKISQYSEWSVSFRDPILSQSIVPHIKRLFRASVVSYCQERLWQRRFAFGKIWIKMLIKFCISFPDSQDPDQLFGKFESRMVLSTPAVIIVNMWTKLKKGQYSF